MFDSSVMELSSAICMTGTLVMIVIFTMRVLMWYMVVPTILIWVHVVGSLLQHNQVGPQWMQGHLHDLGVATMCVPIVVIALAMPAFVQESREQIAVTMVNLIMKCILPVHFAATLICSAHKVSQVTIYREEYIAQGYSGELDWDDMWMFVLGFIIMVINHYAMRPSVRRRRKAITN